MAIYRAKVLSTAAAANGDVHLDCLIQKQVEIEGEPTWVDVPNGHRTMVLAGAAVRVITDDASWTDNQKRTALAALFRETAESWGIDVADEANTGIEALVSFPLNVAL